MCVYSFINQAKPIELNFSGKLSDVPAGQVLKGKKLVPEYPFLENHSFIYGAVLEYSISVLTS